MNGKRGRGPVEQSASPLVHPEAGERIGTAFGERLNETLDSTGKALTVIAGFGAFFFGAGYFVEWQRYKHGGLPPEEMLPLIPTAQVAAAGVRELVISVLFVVLTVGILGLLLVRATSWARGRTGRFARALCKALESDAGFPTAIVLALTVLLVPFTVNGMLVAVILAALLYYGLNLIRRFLEAGDGAHFPLWRLALAVGLAAIVLSATRLAEFPEPRPKAVVWLVGGEVLEGDYLANDAGRVLIRLKTDEECVRKCRLLQGEGCGRKCIRPRLVILRSTDVARIEVAKRSKLLEYDGSLLETLLPDVPFTCIPPECRWNEDRRVGLSSFL